jgi:ATP-dependent RNA helicase DDX24/MAK5
MEEDAATSAMDTTSATEAEAGEADTAETSPKKKKKRAKRKKKKKDDDDETTTDTAGASPVMSLAEQEDQAQQITALQFSWMSATAGVSLHLHLAASLLRQSFWTPTPIQAAVLPAAVLGRRNIVGAAPTGSGKTLAFLLPICQYLLEQRDANIDTPPATTVGKIQALIVTPTRELAMQIHAEAAKLWATTESGGNNNTVNKNKNHPETGLIVGGLAHAKQQRVLEKSRPPIIVATPGRLWELVR